MKKPLKRATPESKGISSARVEKLLRDLNSIRNEVHGFMLAVDGAVICESFPAPYAPDIPHTCHSMGKSYTATALGVAVTEGLISVEDRLVDIFKEEIETMGIDVKPGMEKVKVRDMLSMSSGTKGMPMLNDTWLENFLAAEIVHEPGTSFLYNTTGACVIGAIDEKVTGMKLPDYLQGMIFDKIGISRDEIVWQSFCNGYTAEPGLCATTEANLRLGMLYANYGNWEGEQLIDENWMREATRKQVENGPVPGADNASGGYGWQLWIQPDPSMFRFDGGQGQLDVICPSKKAVAAIHQGGWHPVGCDTCLNLLQEFLKEIGDEPLPEDPEAYASLCEYASTRSIAALPASAPTAAVEELYGTYFIKEGNIMPYLEVAPGHGDFWYLFQDRSVNPLSVTVEVRPANEGIRLTFNGNKKFLCGTRGRWVVQKTPNVLPGVDTCACCAEYMEDGSLHVIIKWLNGWSVSDMTIKRGEKKGDLEIENVKRMLHENVPPIVQNAKGRKIRL